MIINETWNDVENNYEASLHNNRFMRLVCGAMIPFILIALGIGLLFADVQLFFSIFLFFVAAFFLVWAWILLPLSLKKAAQKTASTISKIKYTFRENEFVIDHAVGGSTQYGYNSIMKCEEFPKMWILHLRTGVKFITKTGMIVGSAEDLTALLGVKIGNKYKVVKL